MTSVRRKSSDRPLLGIALLAMSTVFWFLERSTFSWGFGWHYALAGGLVIWYLRMLIRDHRAASLTSFYQFYYSLGMLASAAIVASGAPMVEINAQGSANGFFWLMFGFFIVGIEATCFGYRSGDLIGLRKNALRLPVGIDWAVILAFAFPSLLLSVYVFALTGGPVLAGVDRVTFWKTLAPPGTSILPSLITQSFFFVAYLYLWRRRSAGKLLLPKLFLVAYVLAGVLILGEKFSLFIAFLNMWLIVLVGIIPEIRFSVRHAILGAIIAMLLLLVVAISYVLHGYEAAFILVRAALQSQLLWGVVNEPGALSLLPVRPECYFGCDWLKDGRDYISFRYLPTSLYNLYDEGGTKLSGFLPALPLLTIGGILTFVIHVVVCFNLGVVQRKISKSLGERQLIYGFLLFKLQFSTTLIWFGGTQEAVSGLSFTLAAIVIYRFVSAVQSDTGRSVQQRA